MYLRFVSAEIDWHSKVEAGIFTAAVMLLSGGSLAPYDEERLAELFRWFDDHLEEPPRFSRRRRPGGPRRAVCWFKPEAREHLAKAHEMAALLDAYDVPVRMIKSARVGYVVYEDEHQIVAEPFADLRR